MRHMMFKDRNEYEEMLLLAGHSIHQLTCWDRAPCGHVTQIWDKDVMTAEAAINVALGYLSIAIPPEQPELNMSQYQVNPWASPDIGYP